MSIDEFSKTQWRANMFAVYRGDKRPIVSVNFEEYLIGLESTQIDDPDWVRCENIELLDESV